MLFSATMSDEVKDLAAVSLNRPVKIFVDSNKDVAFNLRQEFIRIRQEKEADREALLAALVCRTFRDHCIIFVQTKKQAHRLHILLGLLGVKIVELHGNLTQPQRLEALDKFKKEESDVMVATDVAARGLDIAGVQTVINFVMPATLEHYIHRVGRTARAGRAGVSVSLAGETERKIVKEIVKRATKPVKSRVIPPDIVDKYKNKLENIEPEITRILQEEYEERLLSKAENQAKRAEKLLKGEVDPRRPWFQTKQQRKEEKDKLSIVPKAAGSQKDDKNKKQQKKKKKEDPEDRVSNELKKVALLQARTAKRGSKQKRLNICIDATAPKAKQGVKRKKSNFTDELTNTSKGNAKKMRYNGKAEKKFNKKGLKTNKKAVGKAFGKPQQKKARR